MVVALLELFFGLLAFGAAERVERLAAVDVFLAVVVAATTASLLASLGVGSAVHCHDPSINAHVWSSSASSYCCVSSIKSPSGAYRRTSPPLLLSVRLLSRL